MCVCITSVELSWNSEIYSYVCVCVTTKPFYQDGELFRVRRVLPRGDVVRLLFGREKQKPFKLYSICIKCQEGMLLFLGNSNTYKIYWLVIYRKWDFY
jgi:hypothetical protein